MSEELGFSGVTPTSYFCFSLMKVNSEINSVVDTAWYTCRESFQSVWRPINKNILYCFQGNLENAIKLVKDVEQKLELSERTEVGACNTQKYPGFLAKIIWLKTSSFWTSLQIRKSFLTAVLKSSHLYDGTDLTSIVPQSRYFKDSALGFHKFLEGYTCYNGDKFGWVQSMTNRGEIELEELLVKPANLIH